MPNSYVLVNPYIKGEMKTQVKTNNSQEAAKFFYTNLSEHFNNAVPKFYFTVQKGGSGNGKFYHFQVTETRNNESDVNFTIKPFTIENENINEFTSKLSTFKNKFAQKAGSKKSTRSKKSKKSKKSSDSSDESESSDNYYNRVNTYTPVVNQPISYWWYDPLVYNVNSVYTPTFYSYITPIIEFPLTYYYKIP